MFSSFADVPFVCVKSTTSESADIWYLQEELRQLSPEVNEVSSTAPSFPQASPFSHADSNSAVLTLLKERLENYEGAHQEAVYQKETSKISRYARTIKVRRSLF